MIINDLDGYYIVFDTKNWNTELDTLVIKLIFSCKKKYFCAFSQILPLCSGIIHRSTYSLIAVRYTVIPRMMTKDCLRNR